MPAGSRKRPTKCKQCGKSATPERTISYRALCPECAFANIRTAARQQIARDGRIYDAWCDAMTALARRLD